MPPPAGRSVGRARPVLLVGVLSGAAALLFVATSSSYGAPDGTAADVAAQGIFVPQRAPPELARAASMGLSAGGSLPESWTRPRPARPGSSGRAYSLALCCSTKDDAMWLAEWIEFHLLVGVDHFFIIDDESQDGSSDIIRAYAAAGVATYIPGPVPDEDPRLGHAQGGKRDAAFTAMCWDHAASHADWLILMDTDEYMYPRVGCDLGDFVRTACDPVQTHVLVRWEMFGSGGHVHHPKGLLAENFLTSGGDCHTLVPQLGRSCADPFAYCGECRHTKFIANTGRCLPSTRHARNHWPQRLDEARPGCREGWVPTTGARDQQNRTIFRRRRTDPCNAWWQQYQGAATAPAPLPLAPQCCDAGIALNHYSPKSREAHSWRVFRKQRNGLANNRSRIPELGGRDRNEALSVGGIMRFLDAWRRRMGRSARSPAVSFLPSKGGARCFVEQGWQYVRDMAKLREAQGQRRGIVAPGVRLLPSRELEGVDTARCCAACGEWDDCAAFTWAAAAAGRPARCSLHPRTPAGRHAVPVSVGPVGPARYGSPLEALERRPGQGAAGVLVRDECPDP
eukprot:TRINITY_DN65726_c0_g1_i1.p1 TRINITY_DN65726_c0_g1~~TRINITY_DN65726_c0_g1_i1.p1  ORF type:complete len:600 (+),score=149.12 TRINITY_DN65726_c0_g1_i1:100-1800(+)